MLLVNYRPLLRRLNPVCTRALEAGASLAIHRGHFEVTIEHMIVKLLEDSSSDLPPLMKALNAPLNPLVKAIHRTLDRNKTGNSSRPVFSPLLMTLIQDAWLMASVELGASAVRSGHMLSALLANPERYEWAEYNRILELIDKGAVRKKLDELTEGSSERTAGAAAPAEGQAAEGAAAAGGDAGAAPLSSDSALARFTLDYTALARSGKIDPVLGREREIRQMIDILARRQKNNPIIVGEPGVGKTALVEGLALGIAAGDVPEILRNVELRALDLGLLQAGAGVKGEFENRLTGVIKEVKSSPKPIILFIDEAHTIIGAGGAAGGTDAANILKPALARGELRTIAATTWTEYKKYFEKDAALTRRFQLVKVDEPGRDAAITMLRGLADRLKVSHGVHIRDDAVVAAVDLSMRYISGRLLPDKAVDLLDTCAARVKIGHTAKPADLEAVIQEVEALERAKAALIEDIKLSGELPGNALSDVQAALKAAGEKRDILLKRWEDERSAAEAVLELRKGRQTEPGTPVEMPEDAAKEEMRQALDRLKETRDERSLVPVEVDPEVVAAVVSDWTGIPAGKMVSDDIAAVTHFEGRLTKRIKGQDAAVQAIARRIRNARAGLQDPRQPIGVFLLVGPSGTGKTETALSVADLLFGGERFMCVINMSEFQEKHTVSRLIGSPPGYVGYGEGGVLTEAVRQRPYSVVLLDEVEKADPEVMNLFYQVFDKGMLADGEGRVVDFRNTVIFMTSNLGTDVTMKLSAAGKLARDELYTALKPVLSRHFKPALLARMTVVPYVPISGEVLKDIVGLKLGQIVARVREQHGIRLEFEQNVYETIAARCQEVDTGARNVDHIVREHLLPVMASKVLECMAEETLPEVLTVKMGDDGAFVVA